MTDDGLTPEQVAVLTRAADITAPPPDGELVALVLSGTSQQNVAVRIAAGHCHAGAVPPIIATGGINRHDASTEGREFAQRLAQAGVPASTVRVEDRPKDTWQNVEIALPYLCEAHALGHPLVAVSKWHHQRAVYCLRAQLPEAVPLYVIGWDPGYGGQAVTRPQVPDGRRRVIRETSEVARRVADGSYALVLKRDSAWW